MLFGARPEANKPTSVILELKKKKRGVTGSVNLPQFDGHFKKGYTNVKGVSNEKETAFTEEFKLEAFRLLEEGKKIPSELARELGIRRNQLYKWKEQRDREGGIVFPGPGKRASKGSEAEEISRLKRELAQVKEENEILKKAAAFFARELK